MGILEKISEIEKEIARTQKNKGTTYYTVILFLILVADKNVISFPAYVWINMIFSHVV